MTDNKSIPPNAPGEKDRREEPQESKTVTKPSTKKMSRRTKLLILGLILSLIVAIGAVGVSAYLLLKDKDQQNNNTVTENEQTNQAEADINNETEELTGEDEDSEGEDADVRQIAYMKASNIWVMNTDGTDKTPITTDGNGDSIRYTAMKWKTTNELGYARCDSECNIYTYNLETNNESLEHTPPPFTQSINDIAWTHDASKLGYIFVKADYSREAVVINGATTTSIETFAPPPARGGGYNDGIQIRFSPDDTKVLILNTIVPFGDDTVIADNIDGTNIVKYSDASFPTFDGNDGFYFKHDGKIKKYTFASGTVGVTYNFAGGNGYNLKTSPDRNFIAFWDEESDGSTQLLFHDVAGSPALITDDFANAKWLDSDELVSIKTKNGGLGMGFESDGLYSVERIGGSTTLLDNGNIYNFEIEPE